MVIDKLLLELPNELVIFFYCNRNEDSRRDCTVIFQALLKQLSVQLPGSTLPKSIQEGYKKKETEGHASGHWNLQECKKLICSLLQIHPQTTVLIDGLDEMYPNQREKLLQELKEIMYSQASLVKVFISSRDYEDIQQELDDVPNLYIKAIDNMADIERFVEREATVLIEKKSKILSDKCKLKKEIVAALMSKADGM